MPIINRPLSDTQVVSFDNEHLVHSPIVLIEWENAPGWPIKSISANYREVLPVDHQPIKNVICFADYVHADDLLHLATEVPAYIAQGRKEWQQHYRLKDGLGGYRWIHDHTFAEYDESGELKRLSGFLFDQTQLVTSLQNEQISTERFQHILDLTGTLIWECDTQGQINYINDNVSQIIGYAPEELIGQRKLSELLLTPHEQNALTEKLLSQHEFHNLEHQIISKSGPSHFFNSSALPMQDKQGHFSGNFRGVSIDINFQKTHEKLLQQHEARWRSVLEATGQGVWDWEASTDKVYFSPLWKSMLGYQDEEIGDTLSEWDRRMHPDDKSSVYDVLHNHLRGETEFYESIHRLKHRNGQWIWIQDRGRVFSRDQSGNPIRVIGTHTDVSDVYEERNRLSLLAESLPGTLYQYCLHPDGTSSFPFCTSGIEHIYECSPEDVTRDASCVFNRIHPDDLEQVHRSIRQSANELTPWFHEYRVRLPRQGLRWLRGQANPKAQANGDIVWHGYISDITADRIQRDELSRYQSQYRLAMEATQIGIWSWDISTGNINWTDEAYTLLGYQPNAFTLDYETFISMLSPEDAGTLIDNVMTQLKEQGRFQAQFRLKNAHGDWMWIEGRGRITQYDKQGQPHTMMGTHTDITLSKQVEHDLHKAREEAENATKVKSTILSTVSHEIRTPLSGIIGLSQQAIEQNSPEENLQTLQKIYRSSTQLLHILNDTLDYSKIEAGKLQRFDTQSNLNELAIEIIDLFQGAAANKGLQLSYETLDVPPVVITDELRLRQILTNLISNALKFTEKGSISLTIEKQPTSIAEHSQSGESLLFSIKDTGIGITEDEQGHIFDAYQQANAETSHLHGGTGLGLMISQNLVQLLGGDEIALQSKSGKGSCFSFSIPLTLPDDAEPPVEKAPNEPAVNYNARVLLVDDIEINRDIIRHQLNKFRLQVIEAADGLQALQKVEQGEHFDLVLMDLNMPVLDGFSASAQIRQLQKDLPIIALTASSPSELAGKLQDAGIDNCLMKPISETNIASILQHYLGTHSIEQPIAASPAEQTRLDTLQQLESRKEIFADNISLYLGLLTDFSEELDTRYSLIVQQLQAIIDHPEMGEEQHFVDLHRETHALKGTSANLGLFNLSKSAETLDQSVRENLLPNPEAITTFHQALEDAKGSISQFIAQENIGQQDKPSPEHEDSVSLELTQQQYLELLSAIQANEFIDPQWLEEIMSSLPDTDKPAWQQLTSTLDQLDFQKAETLLRSFSDKLVSEVENA